MGLNRGAESAWWALRIGLGLTAFLMAIGAYTLARLTEARQPAEAFGTSLANAMRTPRQEPAA
jgi:hypothetical protein